MPRMSIVRDEFAETATGRPICRCPLEILEMARRRIPLRRIEIYTMAKASGADVVSPQAMEQDERRALSKIREAFEGFDPLDFVADRVKASKRRRRV